MFPATTDSGVEVMVEKVGYDPDSKLTTFADEEGNQYVAHHHASMVLTPVDSLDELPVVADLNVDSIDVYTDGQEETPPDAA